MHHTDSGRRAVQRAHLGRDRHMWQQQFVPAAWTAFVLYSLQKRRLGRPRGIAGFGDLSISATLRPISKGKHFRKFKP